MSGSAWADYLDARLRLVHEWAGEGMSFEEMAQRLSPEPDQLALALLTPTVPPIPGSARDLVQTWRERCERLERELHALPAAAAVPAPVVTQVRALMSDPDPEHCGCRYWTDLPTAGVHHRECSEAPPAPEPESKP